MSNYIYIYVLTMHNNIKKNIKNLINYLKFYSKIIYKK